MSFFASLFEKKTVDASNLTWQVLNSGLSSKTGLAVNEASALRVSAVYGCCRVICEDIGKLPLKLYQEKKDGSKQTAYDHPLFKVLSRRPNEWQTSMEWRMTMFLHALLGRVGYSYISRDARGRVIELIPLMPSRVKVRQDSQWNVTYEVSDSAGKITDLSRSDVHVLHGLSWDGLNALEVIAQGREAIGLSIAAEESQARLHGQGARPGGVISTPSKLSIQAVERIKAQFSDNYSGVANAYKTMLLDDGLEFKPWAMTGVDSQHLQTRKHQVEEVCRLFRVFPSMIGFSDKTSTYASAESFFGAHVNHTLMPWVSLWEQAISRDLLTERELDDGYQPKFVLQGLLRGDAQSRAAFYESAISRGCWMTRNEARRLEDLDPIPGLDEVLKPMNMQSGEDPEDPEPAEPPPEPKPDDDEAEDTDEDI